MIRPVAALLTPLVTVGVAWSSVTGAAAAPATAVDAAPTTSVVGQAPVHPEGQPDERTSADGDAVSRSGRRAVDPDDSFLVQIDRVRPGVLPTKGNLRLSGTVTNVSDEVHTDLNVHPLSSYAPITSNDELAAAVSAAPEITFGGNRLQDLALLDNSITELQPDATARWSLTIPVDKLQITGGDGVYVVGVQVLATEADGSRDGVADGRARTFVPRVNTTDTRTNASIVVPVREAVTRAETGEIEDAEGWASLLGGGGRLDNIVHLLDETPDIPVSVALDPALLDVADQLSSGNPARNLDPTVTVDDTENEPEAGTAESGSQTSEGSVSSSGLVAQTWRERMVATLRRHDVLALPYGDLEVVGASKSAPGRINEAQEISDDLLSADDITSRPAVIPPTGLMPTSTLLSLPEETAVVLAQRAGGAAATSGADAVRVLSHPALLNTDVTGAADPQDPDGATGLRQRILAEAAVRALSGDTEQMVVSLPDDFDPGTRTTALLNGLDADFIRWRPLDASPTTAAEVDELTYPANAEDRELSVGSFRSAQDAIHRAEALDDVLPLNDAILATVRKEALSDLSVHALADESASVWRLTQLRQWVDDRLSKVSIDAPSFVILSSETGPFSVTVHNELDQPVTFAISAGTGGAVEIRAPGSIELAADTSRTIRLEATTKEVGVHEVNLQLNSPTGQPLNVGEELNIRSNSVGKIIWFVLAGGLGLLAIAVPLRIYRRVRKVRAAGAGA
ncbi:DUF6049 family protein [Nocardioides alcanivorans]|uniref:DUF6049 family protein n=1 Tax=Nocardioides alcanivorans TaxID=2897352 RepID=UPI001F179E53|nr:DUF6049 family protein [Nocardioides alcanivorans]